MIIAMCQQAIDGFGPLLLVRSVPTRGTDSSSDAIDPDRSHCWNCSPDRSTDEDADVDAMMFARDCLGDFRSKRDSKQLSNEYRKDSSRSNKQMSQV